MGAQVVSATYCREAAAFRAHAPASSIRRATLAGALVLLLLILALPAAASAAAPGAITGKVTAAATGAGIGGIEVTAYRFDEVNGWAWAARTTTKSHGSFRLGQLSPDLYLVGASDLAHLFATPCYYGGAGTSWYANWVQVGSSATNGIDIQLARGSHITGLVTDTAGTPLGGVSVTATASYDPALTRTAVTAADGTYDIGGLPGGAVAGIQGVYDISFHDPSGAHRDEARTYLFVDTEATLADVNATLQPAGTIAGRMSGVPGGPPVSAFAVNLYRRVDYGWQFFASTDPDGDGDYVFGGLPPGGYMAEFSDAAGGYHPEYYDDESIMDWAAWLELSEGQRLTGVDAVLSPVAGPTGIAGVVRDTAGQPVAGVEVSAGVYDYATFSATTDASGAYRMEGLPKGEYDVMFSKEGYALNYYQDAFSWDLATFFVLQIGEMRSDIDATLHPGGQISGHVSTWDGRDCHAWVTAYRFDENGDYGWQNGADVDETGAFTIGELPPGTYIVEAWPWDWPVRYPSEWYRDAADAESAIRLTLEEGGSVTGVDIILDDLGSVSGRLLQVDGTPVLEYGYANLTLVGGDEGDVWGAMIDGAGWFTVKGLPEGDYRVSFWGWEMSPEYYDDAETAEDATLVHVGRSQDVVLPDVTLEPAGHITGRVALKTGESPEGIYVEVYRDNGDSWGWETAASCDANGAFDIGQLGPGTYKLSFTDWDQRFQGQQFYGGDSLDTATPVPLVKSETASIGDVVLGTWSHIRGQVTDDRGTALQDVNFTVYTADGSGGFSWVSTSTTDEDGRYDLKVAAGTYFLQFSDPYNRGLGECYENADTLEAATPVVVGPDEVVPGIDAALSGGHITGTVTGVVEGARAPLDGVQVYAYEVGDLPYAYPVSSATTDAFGFYDLPALASGEYVVAFADPDGRGAPEYYDDLVRIDITQATHVAVTREATTPGIDAHLTGAHITGHVQDEGGAPVVGARVWAGGPCSNSARTDEHGDYDIGGLLPGDYLVEFWDEDGPGQPEWYDDVEPGAWYRATRVRVERDGLTEGIDATLDVAHITGVVRDTNGWPLDGVEAELYRWRWSEWPWGHWEVIAQATTGADGVFDLSGFQPGWYRLGFRDPRGRVITFFWPSGADSPDQADTVALGWHQSLTDLVITQEPSRTVEGVVTSAETGEALEGVVVEAHSVRPCCCGMISAGPLTGTATTDAGGHYRLGIVRSPLPSTGTYVLRFIDPEGDYLAEWQSDVFEARDVFGAEQLWIEKGETVTVDGQMDLAGRIGGRVTNPDGSPFTAGGRVYVNRYADYEDDGIPHTEIGSDGSYEMGGLIPGRYYVRFQPDPPYLGEWWNDWTQWPEDDDDWPWRIELGLSEVRGGVNAVLSPPRTIGGLAKDGLGKPLSRVDVTAYRQAADGTWLRTARTSTDAAGFYQFPTVEDQWETLRDGVYRLEFSRSSFGSEGGLVARWWPDAGSLEEAQDLTIVNADLGGIDVTLAETAPAMVADYAWSTQVAASSSWDTRPPDDSEAWIDVSRAPGVSVLEIEGDSLRLHRRLTLENTGTAPLRFELDYDAWPVSVQPGETAYVEYWDTWDSVRVHASDSFGRQFNEEFEAFLHVRGLRPDVSVEKYVSSGSDPGGPWWEADTEGDAFGVFTGSDLFFRYVVTNTGNCTLPEVTLTDDGVPIATKVNLRRDDPDTWETEGVWTYVGGPFAAASGLTQDVGGVSATLTDTFGRTWTSSAPEEAAWYRGQDLVLEMNMEEEVGTSADGPWHDDFLSVSMGSKIYYRVTVRYDSGVSLVDVPVTDLGATPDDPSDDVVVGTIDIEPGADQAWTRVIGPVNAVYGSVDDTMSVTATWEQGEVTATDGATYTSQYLAFAAAYWAVHPERWGPTGYVPFDGTLASATRVGQVFKASSLYAAGRRKAQSLSGFTLKQSLTFSGGATLNGAAQRLLKAGAAAMLNAKYAETWVTPRTTYPFLAGWPTDPYNRDTITGKVNVALRDAHLSGDAGILLKLSAELEAYNQGIAPW